MVTRLYIGADLAAMAGVKQSALVRPKWAISADFVVGNPPRPVYTEATVRAWCEKHGIEFVPLTFTE